MVAMSARALSINAWNAVKSIRLELCGATGRWHLLDGTSSIMDNSGTLPTGGGDKSGTSKSGGAGLGLKSRALADLVDLFLTGATTTGLVERNCGMAAFRGRAGALSRSSNRPVPEFCGTTITPDFDRTSTSLLHREINDSTLLTAEPC